MNKPVMIVNTKPQGASVLLYRRLYKHMGIRAVTPTGNKLKVTAASHVRPGVRAYVRIAPLKIKGKKFKTVLLKLYMRRKGVITVFHNFVTEKTVSNVPFTKG